MRVLVACEYSGTVRDAFIAGGHDAMSCDVLPTDVAGPHYQGDIMDVLYDGWDIMIAHPPCTYLTNAGVTWLHRDADTWAKLDEGAAFFKALLDAPISKICVENPIMHKYAKERIGGVKQSQTVQPWMFGHTEQTATNNVKAEMMALPDRERQRLHYLPPSADRWKLRSTTYSGLAAAMAEQWGDQEADLLTIMEASA